MADNRENSESPVKFGLEDCEALLQFPYHNYANDLKSESFSESDIDSPNPNFLESATSSNLDSSDLLLENIKNEQTDKEFSNYKKFLKISKTLQVKFIRVLRIIDAALSKTIACQVALQDPLGKQGRKESENKIKLTRPISLFASPYFRDVRGRVPPENEDTIEKMKRRDVTAYNSPPKPWAQSQKDNLTAGVSSSALNIAIKPFSEKRDYLIIKLKDKNLLDEDIARIKDEVTRLQNLITIQGKRPIADLMEEAEGKIDWMKISATNVQGTKSDLECEIFWNNYLSPFVNKGSFTTDEDKKLKILVQKYKAKNWDAIAEELDNGRTAIQCLERYQTRFNEKLTKKYWTPKEDAKLIKIVELHRIGDFIPWNKVCCYMDGRARHQIINRYERTICKEIKRTPFTTQEDAMLLACVKKFGMHWTKMKNFMPGRPTYTMRERYVNTLDTTLKIGDWTKEEDIKLIELIKKHGYGKWANIARDLTGRTDNMCLVRARRLEIHSQRKSGKRKSAADGLVLKPDAPSKQCQTQNIRLKSIRENAHRTLRSALENIQDHVHTSIDLETLDLSSLPISSLKRLQHELFKESENQSTEDWMPHYVPPQFQRTGRIKDRKLWTDQDENVSSESEESESEVDADLPALYIRNDDKTPLKRNQKLWMHEVLKSRFEEQASLVQSGMKSKSVSLNAKETAECAYYRHFLRKKMSCSNPRGEERWDCQYDENYEKRISETIRYFIEPDAEENQPIVLCPNFATVSAYEIIDATRQRLKRTAGFIGQSKNYLQYIIRFTDKMPKCSKCRIKDENATTEHLEYALKSMQNKLLIVDHDMANAAKSEVGFPSETCKCKEIIQSRLAFNLLQKRFLSMFLWPSLLSRIDLNPQQEEIIDKNVANKYNITGSDTKSSVCVVKRKPGRQKNLKTHACRDGVKKKSGKPKFIKTQENKGTQKPPKKGTPRKRVWSNEDITNQKPAKKQSITSTSDMQEKLSDCVNETMQAPTNQEKFPKTESPLKVNPDTPNLRRSRRSCVLQRKPIVTDESDDSS